MIPHFGVPIVVARTTGHECATAAKHLHRKSGPSRHRIFAMELGWATQLSGRCQEIPSRRTSNTRISHRNRERRNRRIREQHDRCKDLGTRTRPFRAHTGYCPRRTSLAGVSCEKKLSTNSLFIIKRLDMTHRSGGAETSPCRCPAATHSHLRTGASVYAFPPCEVRNIFVMPLGTTMRRVMGVARMVDMSTPRDHVPQEWQSIHNFEGLWMDRNGHKQMKIQS